MSRIADEHRMEVNESSGGEPGEIEDEIYVENGGYKHVYAFPNGFIDGYRIQEKT